MRRTLITFLVLTFSFSTMASDDHFVADRNWIGMKKGSKHWTTGKYDGTPSMMCTKLGICWSRMFKSAYSFEEAQEVCAKLRPRGEWTLPTAEEASEAYDHGIIETNNDFYRGNFWLNNGALGNAPEPRYFWVKEYWEIARVASLQYEVITPSKGELLTPRGVMCVHRTQAARFRQE